MDRSSMELSKRLSRISSASSDHVVKAKIVLLGDMSVGKTSLVTRFSKDVFTEDYRPTVGGSFVSKALDVKNGSLIMQIWDTAGQERFKSLVPMYLRGASAAILVYDVTDLDSFVGLTRWLSQLTQLVGEIPTALVGNKTDLAADVDEKRAEKYAKNNNLRFWRTSAKTGENVELLFRSLGSEILKQPIEPGGAFRHSRTSVVAITEPPVVLRNHGNGDKKRCCRS